MKECQIKPYIAEITADKLEQQRLNSIHNEVFRQLSSSKLFNNWSGKLWEYKNKGIPAINKGRQLVGQINRDYGQVVVRSGQPVRVDVRPLLNPNTITIQQGNQYVSEGEVYPTYEDALNSQEIDGQNNRIRDSRNIGSLPIEQRRGNDRTRITGRTTELISSTSSNTQDSLQETNENTEDGYFLEKMESLMQSIRKQSINSTNNNGELFEQLGRMFDSYKVSNSEKERVQTILNDYNSLGTGKELYLQEISTLGFFLIRSNFKVNYLYNPDNSVIENISEEYSPTTSNSNFSCL